LKQLLIVVTVIACAIVSMHSLYVVLTHFRTAANVPHVDWLPDSASDVSYYKSYQFTAYEFDIPEADFVAWSWHDLKPITKPIFVERYTYRSAPYVMLSPVATQAEIDNWEEARGRHQVFNGLFFQVRRSNGGGVTVVYDRDQGRGYF